MKKVLNINFKNYYVLMISFILVLSYLLNFNQYDNTITLKYNGFLSLLVIILITFFLKRTNIILSNGRLKKYVYGLSFIISSIYILCFLTHNYFIVTNYLYSLKFFLFVFIKFLGCYILFFYVIYTIFSLILNNKITILNYKPKYFKFAYPYFWAFIILIIFYIPYLINSYPGYISYDFAIQLKQGLGFDSIVNHHPYISSYVIALFAKFGKFLFDNYNVGIFFYTILQVVIFSLIVVYSLSVLHKMGISTKILLIIYLIFAIFPYFGFYNVWLTKDILFAFGIYLVTIGLVIYSQNNIKEIRTYDFLLFIFGLLLVLLFRKNGIYIIILIILSYAFFVKLNRKVVLLILTIVSSMCICINYPLRKKFEIPNGSINEMMSIPAQQMARIYKYDKSKLSSTEKEKILWYFNNKEIENLYDPLLSDPVKGVLKDDLNFDERMNFLKLSIKLLFKYPITSIESFLCTTYNFYYLNNEQFRGNGKFYGGSIYSINNLLPDEINIKIVGESKIMTKLDEITFNKNFPVLNCLTNVGFYVNMYIILIAIILYKKQYYKLIAFLPISLVFLTQLAGPVVDQRYTYSLVILFPFLVTYTLLEYKIKANGA